MTLTMRTLRLSSVRRMLSLNHPADNSRPHAPVADLDPTLPATENPRPDAWLAEVAQLPAPPPQPKATVAEVAQEPAPAALPATSEERTEPRLSEGDMSLGVGVSCLGSIPMFFLRTYGSS